MNNEITNRRFTLNEARELLPSVQEMTAEAVKQAEAVADAIDEIDEDDPERTILGGELKAIVDEWSDRIREMGLEAKGLWLVTEPSLSHYHGYDEGFAGRMKIQ